MQNRMLYILLGLVAAILLIRASVFTVTEGRLAIKSIGGQIVDSEFTPGLHFRIPLVHEVALFDKRIITQLYPAERFLTREQEQLNVDFYVKWRISNLRRFYEATGGTEEVANARLGETIKDSIKSVVTQRSLQQVITDLYGRRAAVFAAPAADGAAQALAGVYAPGSRPEAADAAQVRALAQAGEMLRGFVPTVVQVTHSSTGADRAELRLVDRWARYDVVPVGHGGAMPLRTGPARPPADVRMVLVRTAVGWRITDVERLV